MRRQRAVCVLLTLWCAGMSGDQLRGDDWLRDVAQPGEQRFRAARYQQPAASGSRAENADNLPAPRGSATRGGRAGIQADRLGEGSFILEQESGRQGEIVAAPPELLEELGVQTPLDAGLYEFGWPIMSRAPGAQFFAGAEYLYVRPTFSQSIAFAEIRNPVGNTRQTLQPHDFGYDNRFRTFVGYRRLDCGAEIRFTYTHLGGDDRIESDVAPLDQSVIFAVDPELQTGPGERIVSSANVNANLYDIGLSKTYYFGQVPADPCPPMSLYGCAPWDLTWTFDARIADVSWDLNSAVVNGNTQRAQGATQMSFSGAGPRMGLEGRRYFNRARSLSLFARGSLSLILGHYEFETRQVEPGTMDVDSNQFKTKRTIPVTEIELGAAWTLRERTTISAGYLFQAWHDLGMTNDFGGQFLPLDDANILAFDGLFVRGELTF